MRWRTDKGNIPDDIYWNQVWFCKKEDVFPVRAVVDHETWQVRGILCWKIDHCRVCPNLVPTIHDDTEEYVKSTQERLRKIEATEWKWIKYSAERNRRDQIRLLEVSEDLETEREVMLVRAEIEKLTIQKLNSAKPSKNTA